MRKKGDFLVNNILSVIIAVIGIVLFVFGISKIYQVRASDELTNAKKTIELIEAKINALDEGQKSELTIQGFAGAESWYLVGWNKEDSSDIKPEKCFFNSCICICNGASKDVCQKKGICKDFVDKDISVSSFYDRVYFEPDPLDGSEWADATLRCIKLNSNLMQLKFDYKDNLFNLSTVHLLEKE